MASLQILEGGFFYSMVAVVSVVSVVSVVAVVPALQTSNLINSF
jgi:hypothetical protein